MMVGNRRVLSVEYFNVKAVVHMIITVCCRVKFDLEILS